uniref:Uncharacterized protein n=1 Tax=Cacopsylla melanoneura TaxID=428564 RepID=A0A8D8PQ27_9HEMI
MCAEEVISKRICYNFWIIQFCSFMLDCLLISYGFSVLVEFPKLRTVFFDILRHCLDIIIIIYFNLFLTCFSKVSVFIELFCRFVFNFSYPFFSSERFLGLKCPPDWMLVFIIFGFKSLYMFLKYFIDCVIKTFKFHINIITCFL